MLVSLKVQVVVGGWGEGWGRGDGSTERNPAVAGGGLLCRQELALELGLRAYCAKLGIFTKYRVRAVRVWLCALLELALELR